MKVLEDILRVLGVTGHEVERVLNELHVLAASRGSRRLAEKLPPEEKKALSEFFDAAVPEKTYQIIAEAVRRYFDEATRQAAYETALHEILQEEFFPSILRNATQTQKQAIDKILVG